MIGENCVKQIRSVDKLVFSDRIINSSHRLQVYNQVVGKNYVKQIHGMEELFFNHRTMNSSHRLHVFH